MRGKGTDKLTLAVCFGQFGPYHHARVAVLQEAAKDQKTKRPNDQETRVVPVQIAAATSTYAWSGPSNSESLRVGEDQATNAVASPPRAAGLRTLCEGLFFSHTKGILRSDDDT